MTSRRMIDPAIWHSEDFARFTFRQRVLFIGLFSNADDQGRMRAHPALVRSIIFPYDDIPLDELQSDLETIAAAACIEIYNPDSKTALQILNWWKYQSPQWAYPSRIAPPDGWCDRERFRKGNNIYTQNWETPGGKPLPDILPKGPANATTWHPSIVQSSVELELDHEDSGADAPSANADLSAVHLPVTFQEWQETVRTAKTKPGGSQAAVRRMIETLYVGLDPPDYAYIAKTARQVGGFGRLVDLLWQQNPHPPTGDLLAYIQGVAKNGNRRGGSGPPIQQVEIATGFVEWPNDPVPKLADGPNDPISKLADAL